jgi:methylenetetrahydrofolate--tRNA-(uracil-5-)-methyltransferase
MTEAHRTGFLGELVCSNSFKSDSISNSNGLLKLELRILGSLLIDIAGKARVPAGKGLCVDRDVFAAEITRTIETAPGITVVRQERDCLSDDSVNVLAPGPLASASVSGLLEEIVGLPNLFFYDAVSPIVEADSIDTSVAYKSSRYGKGEATYLNIPLERDRYFEFIEDLKFGRQVSRRSFEQERFFSACMPIEELARKGRDTLAHGCMKPVGLEDPRTGRMPYAVVQLRPENLDGTLYGMVGFQTRLTYGEQERVFGKLPGLRKARWVRLGSMHRNTYVRAPRVLSASLEHRERPGVFLAGQITGAEGYVAAMATGLVAGINAARRAKSLSPVVPPRETMVGGLLRHISDTPVVDFQPMNPNFGLVPSLGMRIRNKLRKNLLLAERSAFHMKSWVRETGLDKGPEAAVKHSGVLS